MAFRNIYTGGACTADGTQQMSQNPFKQFMDRMLFGQTQQQQIQQQINVQQDPMVQQKLQERQRLFESMNQQWDVMAKQYDQANIEQRQMMEKMFVEEQRNYEQAMMQQQMMMDFQWQQAEIQYQADQMAQEYQFQEAYENAEDLQMQSEKSQKYADDLVQALEKDPDPRFQQSKFLRFMKDIQNGNLKLVGNELLHIEGIQTFEEGWDQATKNVEQKQSDLSEVEEKFSKMWDEKLEKYDSELQNEDQFQKKLEDSYQQILKEMKQGTDIDKLFSEAWQAASDLQEFDLYKDSNNTYRFQENNKYLTMDFPLQAAFEFSTLRLKIQKQSWLWEAHIPKESSRFQCMENLGAVASFLNAMKQNPNELDTLSALGISCTNILDEVKAMSFLKQWLIKNPNYTVPVDDSIVPGNTNIYDYTLDQIKCMNARMIQVFEAAHQQGPNDVELLNGLAVLYFIERNYQKSVEIFKKALQIEPKNYQIWNKLGATLAHLGEADQAMFCYHRALDLRPNYVRVWVNLAFAYSYKGEYLDAARLYLSALMINPQARHIWGYLQTAFLQLQRPDLISKIQHYDPMLFKDEFSVTNPNDLPEPEILYREANNLYIFKMPEEEWLKTSQKKP
ncbi:unnamed protein product (macronuclear) [Paramecium tetraurelia]|uniref:Uncharacterized protein n=1 Tax=Paramecium tetraurelia TaxID=5888 RepID=A0DB56_PARTE|nr:uncharacterized protein GSPATT00015167001 [Paramecium tetraurelia]CAK80273.1 unnamed protein product [Paramecium tetraurelia]|eukprot:XP_001447670.1 hypothetical protein (macronuclear) [Paramecium tetraurelia strain d4-2]